MSENTRIGAGLIGPYSELLMMMAALIVGGATAHGLYQWQSARQSGRVYEILDFIISFGLAVFSGVIFGIIAQLVTNNTNEILIACSMGAFLGVKGINAITEAVLDTILKGRSGGK